MRAMEPYQESTASVYAQRTTQGFRSLRHASPCSRKDVVAVAIKLTTVRLSGSTRRVVPSRIERAAWLPLLLLATSAVVSQVAHGMPISVLQPTYSTLTLDVEPSDTIESVKAKLQDSSGIASESQYLYFAGQLMEDGFTLSDYNVTRDSTIPLVATSAFAATPLPNTAWSFGVNSMTGGSGIGWTLWQTSEAVDFSPFGNGAISLTVFGYNGSVAGTPADYSSASSYTLPFFTATAGISGFSPSQFSITGTFAGVASVSQSGNTIRLEVAAVPEPAGLVLAGIGMLVVSAARRRRASHPLSAASASVLFLKGPSTGPPTGRI